MTIATDSVACSAFSCSCTFWVAVLVAAVYSEQAEAVCLLWNVAVLWVWGSSRPYRNAPCP